MKQTIRLTESELRNIVKESVSQILKETSLGYDVDNFSGRHTKAQDDTEEITGDVFAYEVDDSKKSLYLFGRIPVYKCEMAQKEAQRYGNGYVDWHENEIDYKKAVKEYLGQGYTITNQQ